MSPTLAELLEAPARLLHERAPSSLSRHPGGLDRDALIAGILDHTDPDHAWGSGVCELHTEGFGFLRSTADALLPGPSDIYLSPNQVRRMALQTGDTLIGRVRPPQANERYPAMIWVGAVNGRPADEPRAPSISERSYPDTRMPLLDDDWLEAVDRVAPLGLGARGVIVSEPHHHRGALLRRLATRLAAQPELEVTALRVGARPEETSEWRRIPHVEVLDLPLDEAEARFVGVMDLVTSRAARRADAQREHVLLVDDLEVLWHAAAATGLGDGRRALRRWLARAGDRPRAGSVTLIATLSPGAPAPLHGVMAALGTWRLRLGPRSDDALSIDASDSGTFHPTPLRGPHKPQDAPPGEP